MSQFAALVVELAAKLGAAVPSAKVPLSLENFKKTLSRTMNIMSWRKFVKLYRVPPRIPEKPRV